MRVRSGSRVLAHKAMEAVKDLGYNVWWVSERDGFIIFMAENTKRILIWVRGSPVTREALNLLNKIIGKYSYDHIVVLKNTRRADLVRFPPEYTIVTSVEELIALLKAQL